MEHTAKGKPKLLKHCTLPLTAMNQVNLIVTELGVFTITPQGIEIIEIAPDTDLDYVQSVTAAELIVSLTSKPCLARRSKTGIALPCYSRSFSFESRARSELNIHTSKDHIGFKVIRQNKLSVL